MRTILRAAVGIGSVDILFLAFCACATLALAEEGSTAAGDQPAGPVALTEAQMDEVTAGGSLESTPIPSSTYDGEGANPFDLIWDIEGGGTSSPPSK